MNTLYKEYDEDVALCRKIHRHYGKSFYFGTKFFSRAEHDATCVLYAFFRYPDEYVDTYYSTQKEVALEKLNRWSDMWSKIYKGETSDAVGDELKILRAAAYVFKTYNIPFEYSQTFLGAMIQDTWKERYDTYEDLVAYMYGSASVVGLMMTYVMCSSDARFRNDSTYREEVLSRAQALGEAFQLTNFLRDVGEDIATRGRIYLPLEDLKEFSVTEEDIKEKKITPEFITLMKFEIQRTRTLYETADIGVTMLPPRAAKGVRIARVLYSKILDEIEVSHYDVYTSRVHLSFLRKIRITIPLIFKKI